MLTKSLKLGLIVALMQVGGDLRAQESLQLAVGQEISVDLPDIAKAVDLSNADVVSVSKGRTKQTLYLKGLRVGQTKMVITLGQGKRLNYSVVVGNKLKEIERQLKTISGIKYEVRSGRIHVQGTLSHRQAKVKLNQLKRRYGNLIIDTTEAVIASNSTVVRTINRILRENDIANIQAHAYGRIVVLEGSAKNESQAEMALRIARIIYPSIENRIAKDSKGGPSVSIEVMFVEVRKSNDKTVGFKNAFGNAEPNGMQSGVAQAVIEPKGGSIHRGNIGMQWQVGWLATFLELIQERSVSRVLSNPKLITRTGTKAKFHSGHVYYLTNRTADAQGNVLQELEPVEAGIILNVTPKIDEIGQIDSVIKTSVSDFAQGSDGAAPKLSKSSVDTEITINDGQTIMLSGLTRKSNSKVVARVPILADIPVVGELFKSRKTKDEETELLILVTMNRISSHDDRIKAAGHQLWDKAGEDVEFNFYD